MTIPTIQPALNAGEISPQLFGRTDLDKYRKGCSTLRNMFASYRGGALSRAGTAFVGQSKQPGTANAPVLIPFQFSTNEGIMIEAGDNYFRFIIDGAYVTEAPFNISAITQANPGVITATGNNLTASDWVFIAGIVGPTQLNGEIFQVVSSVGGITLQSTLTGVQISTIGMPAYVSGGTIARIYTLATPYAAADLPLLKWAESADVMSLTHTVYAPLDLSRITDSSWTTSTTTFSASIGPPTAVTAAATVTTTSNSFSYQYVMTAVNGVTGDESIASNIASVFSVNIASQLGTININGTGVTGAGSYNLYRAPENLGPPANGSIFGFVASAFGPSFTDDNITPDFAKAPPLHDDPFAPSAVLAINVTSPGTGISMTASVAISTSTGVNFIGQPIIINGGVAWVAVYAGGRKYSTSDTVFVNDSGVSTSAKFTLTIGPGTGTFPGVCAYFQQRRFYAQTLNLPDTYFASQPGAFTNMDSSLPVKDDDAIIGSPWSQQVNGIVYMLNMPGGLVIFTGLGAWQLSGTGTGLATGAAITPSNQVAVPQAFNGSNAQVRPIPINYDIIYLQTKGAVPRDFAYNFFVNIYTGTDLSVLSEHLFAGHTITRWDWSEEPNKLLWCVRDDGVLLCLTYLKEQDVYSWSRHDTNGQVVSVGCITEPPVDATYVVVKRLIQGSPGQSAPQWLGVNAPIWAYYIERMDNRLWSGSANSATLNPPWCVDAGLRYTPATPNATLTLSSAAGVPTLQAPTIIFGGQNYSAQTFGRIVDPTGKNATLALTIAAGVLTAVALGGNLVGYTNPQVQIVDPTGAGTGAIVNISILNLASVSASSGVFTGASGLGALADRIRIDGGIFAVTNFNSSTSLTVKVLRAATATVPNDPLNTPFPQPAKQWSISAPITTVFGLNHLEGMTVSVLADGNVLAPQVVVNGSITLPGAISASDIVIGLPFAAQLQTLYLDIPAPVTVQGRRKTITGATIRVQGTGGPFQIGTDQPDASVQPYGHDVPWTNMTIVNPPFGTQQPEQPFGLFTGDVVQDVFGSLGLDTGQVAVQQLNPLPLNVLAVLPLSEIGDDPG